MEIKIAEGLSKAIGETAGKSGASSGGMGLAHNASPNDVQAFQQQMQGGPHQAEFAQHGVRPADGAAPAGGPHDRASSILGDIQKQMDRPHQELYTYMKDLGQKSTLSTLDVMSLTAKVNMLGITTQAQMNVVKKTTQNAQTFLRNQG